MALTPAGPGRFAAVLAFAAFAGLVTGARAQDGFADPTFGNFSAGFSTIAFDLAGDNRDLCEAVAARRDGRIVLAGSAQSTVMPTSYDAALALLHADGTPDSNFNFSGQLHFDVLNLGLTDTLFSVGELSDGTIVAAGSSFNGMKYFPIVALVSTNGIVLDERILGYPGSAGFLALAVQPDDKIVLAGWVNRNTNDAFLVLRLLPDLARDFGFGSFGEVKVDFDLMPSYDDDLAYTVAIQQDGKIVVAGEAEYGQDDTDMAVVRLLPSGSPDPSYGISGTGRATVFFDRGPNNKADYANGVAIDPLGRTVLAGCAESDVAPFYRAAIARLTSGGVGDSGFGNMAFGRAVFPSLDLSLDCASDVEAQSDSKIVFGGTSESSSARRLAAARLTDAGLLDGNWGGGFGVVSYNVYYFGASDQGLAVDLDAGRALVAGSADVSNITGDFNFAVMRLVSSLIFRDGFEIGSTANWSSSAL